MGKVGTSSLPLDTVFTESIVGAGDFNKATAQTTDATTANLLVIPLDPDTTRTFEFIISAKGPTSQNYWARITCGVRRTTSGSAVIIGVSDVEQDDENAAGYTAVVDANGNDLRLRITGAASETVDWKVIYVDTDASGSAGGASSGVAIVTGVERDTGDTLDGENIFEKVVDLGTLPNNGTINVAHGITGISRPLSLVSLTWDGSNQMDPMAFGNNDGAGGGTYIRMNANSANINVFTNINKSASDAYATFRYTKT